MLRMAVDLLFRPQMFMPTARVNHFREVDPFVHQQGGTIIYTDKDDTITAYRQFGLFDQDIKDTLARLADNHIQVSILSNGIRTGDPSEVEKIPVLITQLKKPFNAEQILKVCPESDVSKIWIVGDRLMTDIYLANTLKCKSILVAPLQQTTMAKHGLGVYLLRSVESLFMAVHSFSPK